MAEEKDRFRELLDYYGVKEAPKNIEEEILSPVNEANDGIEFLLADYEKAVELIQKAGVACTGADLFFYIKSKTWLTDSNVNAYVCGHNVTQAERETLEYWVDLKYWADLTDNSRSKMAKLINKFAPKQICQLSRFDDKMDNLDDIQFISSADAAANEFMFIARNFTDVSYLKKQGDWSDIDKTEAKDGVGRLLNEYIRKTSGLKKFMAKYDTLNTQMSNILHIIDKETKTLAKDSVWKKDEMQSLHDSCEALQAEFTDSARDKRLTSKTRNYSLAYADFIGSIKRWCELSLKIIDKYTEGNTIMIYSADIKNCASKVGVSLGDTFTDGTDYENIFKGIVKISKGIPAYAAEALDEDNVLK